MRRAFNAAGQGTHGQPAHEPRARRQRTVSPAIGRLMRWAVLVVFLLMVGLVGYTTYRSREEVSAVSVVSQKFGNINDADSVNGFAVLGELLEQRGNTVSKTTLLSPQLDQFEILLWFHEATQLPQPEAFERVQQWLEEDARRLLVFIGNDHNAKTEFMEQVYRNSTMEDRQWARLVSRRFMSRDLNDQLDSNALLPQQYRPVEYPRIAEGEFRSWFRVRSAPSGFVGRWEFAEDLVADEQIETTVELPAIRVDHYLKPLGDHELLIQCSNGDQDLPLVWTRELDYGGRVLVVSSASFLSNLGIVKPANRPLVDVVLNEIPTRRNVLVLHSGPGDVPLSSTPEDRMVKTWSWMKHGPFPVAILHVLAFAVLFCFARYPVFGRPKDMEFKPRNDFGLHLEEIGRLLRQSNRTEFARARVKHYFDVVKRSLIGRGPTKRS